MNHDRDIRALAGRELLLFGSAIALICFAAGRILGFGWGREIAPTLVALSFLFTALERVRRDPRGSAHYGVALGGLLMPVTEAADPATSQASPRSPDASDPPSAPSKKSPPSRPYAAMFLEAARESAYALRIALFTFPPFILAYALIHGASDSFSLDAIAISPLFILSQFLIIALTEEVFFRGYLQTRLGDLFPARRRILGASLSLPALFVQAAYFALIHFLVIPHPSRLSVFFPALLFGYMRERRGGVGAAIVYHALCNLLAEALHQGYA